MSGVKRDRDLGRKFEAVASKRKRQPELQRKNLELSRSHIKVLKRNDDESVNNNLGEHESGEPVETTSSSDKIVREYRATAEATSLKGPTSVKDHDASGVAVENQHKTVEKISESYDCEPENVYVRCDPG
jgi:hypothetical protein